MSKVNSEKNCSRALLSESTRNLGSEKFVRGSKIAIFAKNRRSKKRCFWEKIHFSKIISAVVLVLVSNDSLDHQLSNDTKTTSKAFIVVELWPERKMQFFSNGSCFEEQKNRVFRDFHPNTF